MNVRMPDGTIISNVPDGMTKEVLLKQYEKPETGFRAPEGFAENLSLPIQEGVRRFAEGVQSENPMEAARQFIGGTRQIAKAVKGGLLGNAIKIFSGKAKTDLAENEKDYKRFLLEDLRERLDDLEREDKEGTDEYKALYSEFQKTYESSAKNLYKEETPDFSLSALVDAVKQDPGAFGAEFVNALVEDPELLVTPVGGKIAAMKVAYRLQKFGKKTQQIGAVAGATAGAAATGAGIIAPISAAEQVVETGEVDPARLAQETAAGAVLSAPFGLFGARAGLRQIARRSGQPEAKLQEALNTEISAGKSLDDALDSISQIIDESIPDKPAKIESPPKKLPENVTELLEGNEKALNKQAGFAKPAVITTLAAAGTGAALGYVHEGRPEEAVAGALAGAALVLAAPVVSKVGMGAIRVAKKLAAKDTRIRIDKMADAAEGQIEAGLRATMQFQKAIVRAIPDEKIRENISHYLEGDKSIILSQSEKAIAQKIRKYFDDYAELGKKEGVLDGVLEDYVPHLWRLGVKSKSEVIDALSSKAGGLSAKTKHAKERTIPTLKEGMGLGFEPVTLDIANIARIYGNSINRAITNKKLIASLKEQVSPEGAKLIQSVDEAPGAYKFINHRQLSGVRVHPDIEPSMRFLFDASDPGSIQRGLLALNFASKRSLVAMSFFHANALLESMMLAGALPKISRYKTTAKIKPAKLTAHEESLPTADLIRSAREGKNAPLAMLLNGQAGDVVDVGLRNGLKIGVIEDVGTDLFYAALKDVEGVADRIFPHSGKVVKVYEKANRIVDNIMWDRIATGGKLTVFAKEFEKELLRSAKRHQKNPKKFPLEDPNVIAADIAEFTNDAFGGLNWRRIAEGVENKMGRSLSLDALSPSGRKIMQLALFAPDWTIANARILFKAIPGVAKNKRLSKLHQKYFMRGAVFTATVGDGINVMMSGHHMWENKDPTYIDLGDGRKMTFSKQFFEPLHWVINPGGTMINKTGVLPKWLLEEGLGKKYVSAKGSPPMYKEDATPGEKFAARLKHTGGKFVPIFIQQITDQGESGLAGFLGHPIYGKKDGN